MKKLTPLVVFVSYTSYSENGTQISFGDGTFRKEEIDNYDGNIRQMCLEEAQNFDPNVKSVHLLSINPLVFMEEEI